METNLSLQSNKSDKSAINSMKALRNTIIDMKLPQDGDTVLLPQRILLHLRHHDGNQAATCGQRGTGIRGNLHPGVNSDFFSSFNVPDDFLKNFACLKFNVLAMDRRWKQYTYRAHVFSRAQFVSVLVPACCHSCTVILSLTSRTDLTYHAWLQNHGAHC